ncbi:MAG: TIGR00296 family protein [Nitrososphaerota archaeon]|nr:TIGR00296 family protein [Nitrososphaerota archaeon]
MTLTDEQGAELLGLARTTVDGFVRSGQVPSFEARGAPFLREVRGAFVTLKTTDDELRGCIGLPYPVKELGEAVVEAAVGAAAHDPRFPRVRPEELDGLLVEVSALTRPRRIEYSSPLELPRLVRIGEDGLIVSNGRASGLLLPQVATEHGMAAEDFLSHTCMKAGLPADAWLTGGVTVQAFQAEVFSEASPRGTTRRELE